MKLKPFTLKKPIFQETGSPEVEQYGVGPSKKVFGLKQKSRIISGSELFNLTNTWCISVLRFFLNCVATLGLLLLAAETFDFEPTLLFHGLQCFLGHVLSKHLLYHKLLSTFVVADTDSNAGRNIAADATC